LGHNRLGRLPKSQRWNEVVGLLETSPQDTASVASAVIYAAEERLRKLASDEGLGYSFWLLTRIAWAARGESFQQDLAGLGISVSQTTSTLQFIAQVSARVRAELTSLRSSGDFAEIGSLALRRTLLETVGQQGPSLFGSTAEDLQRAFRAYSTQVQFGNLAHRFFADFFSCTLRSYVDRELANHVGGNSSLSSITESQQFLDSLDLHARQTARIMEQFSGSWYSKNNYEAQGEISREETQRFVAHALRKIRTELKQQAQVA
jgi:hypothetical protein